MDDWKNRILTFLPVMKEVEAMGHNPVEMMFGDGFPTMEEVEIGYVALSRAKEKYPEWYKVVGKWINKQMKGRVKS